VISKFSIENTLCELCEKLCVFAVKNKKKALLKKGLSFIWKRIQLDASK
jgi:hypothetical protein